MRAVNYHNCDGRQVPLQTARFQDCKQRESTILRRTTPSRPSLETLNTPLGFVTGQVTAQISLQEATTFTHPMSSSARTMTKTSPTSVALRVPTHTVNSERLVFRSTSFFTGSKSANAYLPSPTDVLNRHARNPGRHHRIAIFEELGLVVKFGQPPHVHLDYALTMRAL